MNEGLVDTTRRLGNAVLERFRAEQEAERARKRAIIDQILGAIQVGPFLTEHEKEHL